MKTYREFTYELDSDFGKPMWILWLGNDFMDSYESEIELIKWIDEYYMD